MNCLPNPQNLKIKLESEVSVHTSLAPAGLAGSVLLCPHVRRAHGIQELQRKAGGFRESVGGAAAFQTNLHYAGRYEVDQQYHRNQRQQAAF